MDAHSPVIVSPGFLFVEQPATITAMTGDSLAWFLFVVGTILGIAVSIGTGVFVSIVFVALQMRRDLQHQLDELWLLAVEASGATRHARDNLGMRQEDFKAEELAALNREWRRSMRTFRLSLSDEQFHKLEHAINAVGELHTLRASPQYDRYWRKYPLVVPNGDGTSQTIDHAVDFGYWIEVRGTEEEKTEYIKWQNDRTRLAREIDYLLYVNLDAMDKGVEAIQAYSLPTELERATDFSVLFPKACKWFFSEIGRGLRRWCCGPECAEHCESCAPKPDPKR